LAQLDETKRDIREWVRLFRVSEPSLLRRRELLRRVDTKFVVPADRLEPIFANLEGHYSLVLADGEAWATYRTLYFDTLEERFFDDHRRGRLERFKVRIRHYDDRRVTYFEVKRKSNRHITTKIRRPKEFSHSELSAGDLAAAAQVPEVPVSRVVPRLWTTFTRLILVGLDHTERLTVDVGVSFRHGRAATSASFDDLAASRLFESPLACRLGSPRRSLAILEVKQPRFESRTPIMLALRREGIRPRSSSKYCTGVLLTNPAAKAHRFLPNLKQIARMQCSSS